MFSIVSIFLVLSIISNIIFLYCCINSLKKIEKYEEWIEYFKSEIDDVNARLKITDEKNLFEKDDDVGFVFSEIVKIIREFNERVK